MSILNLFGTAEHFDERCFVCGKMENRSTSSEIVAERIRTQPGRWKCKECQTGLVAS
jgi:hypothetical protein